MAILVQCWIAAIVVYNTVAGVLAIYNPAILERVFPGSAAIFGEERVAADHERPRERHRHDAA